MIFFVYHFDIFNQYQFYWDDIKEATSIIPCKKNIATNNYLLSVHTFIKLTLQDGLQIRFKSLFHASLHWAYFTIPENSHTHTKKKVITQSHWIKQQKQHNVYTNFKPDFFFIKCNFFLCSIYVLNLLSKTLGWNVFIWLEIYIYKS